MRHNRLALAAALCFAFMGGCAAAADTAKHETAISADYCAAHGGLAEFKLHDNTRIDCYIRGQWAIEHDWATGKVYECIGQALYYSAETGEAAKCVLIRKAEQSDNDFIRYARRAIVAGVHGGVEVECIDMAANDIPCLPGKD